MINLKVFNAKTVYPDGILNVALDQISVPALIVHHEKDYCKGCPPSRVPQVAEALINSPKVEIKYISGGYSGEITPAGEYSKRSELNRGVTGDI